MGSCCQTPSKVCVPEKPEPDLESPPTKQARRWFSLGLLILLAGLAMTVTLAVNLNPPNEPVRSVIHGFLAVLTGVALLTFGWPIFRRVFQPRITLESLFVVGILGAFGASIYSSVTNTGHIYYEVVLVLLAIYRLGQLLSESQLARCRDFSRDIPGLRSKVSALVDDNWITIPISAVKSGDEVKTRSGEVIPVDGVICEGRTFVEESSHTGEPFPTPRSPGDAVKAGTVSLDGEIVIEASVDGTNREIDRLVRALATSEKSPIEHLAQRLINFFVPTVILVSITTFIFWGLWQRDWDAAIFNALAVALVACPCGLGLAIPLSVRRARFLLSRLGLELRDSSLIERLAGVNTVIFDKTGTLTEPQIEVRELNVESGAPENLEGILSAIQRRSTHPVARPFWKFEPASEIEVIEVSPIPARGIEANFKLEDKQRALLIVNDAWMNDHKTPRETSCCHNGNSNSRRLHVILDGKKIATAILEESRRPCVDDVISKLKTEGFEIGVITGDLRIPDEWDEHLSFSNTGATIQQKGEMIRAIQEKGSHVLFVGDGLNDVEAMNAAYASIAVGDGSEVTAKVSSAVLVHNDLTALPEALSLARRIQKQLHRLLTFVLVYNGVGMVLAATGILHPVMAALLMLGSSITVLKSS